MFNVGKLSDGYRLLQTLVNQSAIERKRVEIDEEEVLPPEVKLTSLNSILDDDNGVESVKFHGAISEQIDLPSFGRIRGMNSSVFHEYHHLRCHQLSSVV